LSDDSEARLEVGDEFILPTVGISGRSAGGSRL